MLPIPMLQTTKSKATAIPPHFHTEKDSLPIPMLPISTLPTTKPKATAIPPQFHTEKDSLPIAIFPTLYSHKEKDTPPIMTISPTTMKTMTHSTPYFHNEADSLPITMPRTHHFLTSELSIIPTRSEPSQLPKSSQKKANMPTTPMRSLLPQ